MHALDSRGRARLVWAWQGVGVPVVRRRTGRWFSGRGLVGCLLGLVGWLLAGNPCCRAAEAGAGSEPLSPAVVRLGLEGKVLCVACATANKVLLLDATTGERLREVAMPATPSGMAVTPDTARLLVTCAAPASTMVLVDVVTGKVLAQWAAGHTAVDPVISEDGGTAYVCCRFDNSVAAHSLAEGKELFRVPVGRQPISLTVVQGGKGLLVAHHLPEGGDDNGSVAAMVGFVDLERRAMVQQIAMAPGSTLLRDIRTAPGGGYACVVHDLARYQLPTTQLERGWMNTSALTLIDLKTMAVRATVLLDELDRGAANPWGVAWSADGKVLWVTHAGTHELSRVDWQGLLGRLDAVANKKGEGVPAYVTRKEAEISNDLAFLLGIRTRIALPGRGPRSLVVGTNKVFVAGYFSESVDVVDTTREPVEVRTVRLAELGGATAERKGEEYFNDATLCFQGWQSCASCHGEDARVDGLNWDLLNDGVGNPKNSKSLLFSHRTPPAMSMGVRVSAEVAVRAGLQHILFTPPREEIATALDSWLKSLTPVPSPYLVNGALSEAARRGEKLFRDKEVGCARCHPGELFTDLERYDVGTSGPFDKAGEAFDTPTLREIWRSGPYLHDGSARSVRDVLAVRNKRDAHGITSTLAPGELDDLVAYLLSL